MRVIKFNFTPVRNSSKFLQMNAEVVDKPLPWCIKNHVMPVPDEIDPGPIEPDNIPIPLFENWGEFGKNSDNRSKILPSQIDLNAHVAAHVELRLYGTINLVEFLDANDFQEADTGLKGFLQMLLNTRYIRSSCTFEDLMADAEDSLKIWDKDSIYAFIARVLGKNANNISVADVAHVVNALAGQTIDIEKENFDIMKVAQYMTTHIAATERPDEFFCAAYPNEIMEYEVVTALLAETQDGMFFGKGATFPTSWAVYGANSVMWKANIDVKSDKVEFAPVAGTLYERAIDSKHKMFPNSGDNIPFVNKLSSEATMKILDGSRYKIEPKQFNTGIRYMTTRQELPIYKVCLVSTDSEKLENELNRIAAVNMPPDPSIQDLVDGIVKFYRSEEKALAAAWDDRHFIVYDDMACVARDEKDLEEIIDRAVNADRVDVFTLPGKPQTIRAIAQYVWVLMHMMTDSLCYVAAENDDFTVESAVEYALNLCLKSKKTVNKYLMACAYSDGFGRAKMGTREVVNLDRGIDFDSF